MGIEEYLDHCFGQFVQPVATELGLKLVKRQAEGLGGLYELSGGNLLVRLVNDRGLVSLEIAPASQPTDYWDLEIVSGLFNPPPSRGVQRLNLEEQATLLRERWAELNSRFGTLHFILTRRTLSALGEQRARALFG